MYEWWDILVGFVIAVSLALNGFLFWLAVRLGRNLVIWKGLWEEAKDGIEGIERALKGARDR